MSIEFIGAPNTQSVRLTSVFILRYGNKVYRLVKTEEIPLCIVTMNLWNIRVVNRYENGHAFLSFDGLPGEQKIMTTSTLGAVSNDIVCTEATSTQSETYTQVVPMQYVEEVTVFHHGNFAFLKEEKSYKVVLV